MTDKKTDGLVSHILRNSNLQNTAISNENLSRENARNANKLAKSKIKNESTSGMMLLEMLAADGNETAQDLLEDKVDLHNKRSITNTANASRDRKSKPSKNQLMEIKDEWIKNYAHEYGWKKYAKIKFNISYITINSILKKD